MMIIDMTDHRLWQDFKHQQMHVGTTMICPTGAGCHFIGGMMGDGWRREPSASNDWTADIPWLQMDENSLAVRSGVVHYQADPDQLYARAVGMLKSPRHWGTRRSALGHEPPYITSHVFDFSTDELISITVAEQDCWIPKLLEVYKNKFTTDYKYKTAYLLQLLNSNRYDGVLDNIEYLNAINGLTQNNTCGVDLNGTPFSISYFCDCKAHDRDPSDPDSFESYVLKEINFSDYNRYFNSEYLTYTRAWCGARTELYTVLDYRALFFGMALPDRGTLSSIDADKVSAYSRKNIEILYRAIHIMPAVQREDLWHKVRELELELEQASR